MPIRYDGATKETQILQGLSSYFRDNGYDIDDPDPTVKFTKLVGAVFQLVEDEIKPGMDDAEVNRLVLERIEQILERNG